MSINKPRVLNEREHEGWLKKVSDLLNKLFTIQPNSDVTVNTPLKFGTTTNNTEFEIDGFMKHSGEGKYWKDIDIPLIIRTTGVGTPALTAINGNLTMPVWAVNDFLMCESQELMHSWEEGGTVYFHIHLTTNGSNVDARYVNFELEYGYVTPDGAWVFPAAVTSGDVLIPANTTTKTMKIISIHSVVLTNIKIGGHVLARLKRVASVGTAPTGNPWVAMLQMHVLCDTEGSRDISSK